MLNNVMDLNPQIVSSETSLLYADSFGENEFQSHKNSQVAGKNTAFPVFKSNLFSPVMRLDLIKNQQQRTEVTTAIGGENMMEQDVGSASYQQQSTMGMNSARLSQPSTATVAGIYNLM